MLLSDSLVKTGVDNRSKVSYVIYYVNTLIYCTIELFQAYFFNELIFNLF